MEGGLEPKRISGPQLNRVGSNTGRIFDLYKDGDGFCLREGCDEYFNIKMTRDELRALGEELIKAANEPV
jgi:hypothetical protein